MNCGVLSLLTLTELWLWKDQKVGLPSYVEPECSLNLGVVDNGGR